MSKLRDYNKARARIEKVRVLLEELEYLVEDLSGIWAEETGPENSREEMAPALSGGDRCTMRLAAA